MTITTPAGWESIHYCCVWYNVQRDDKVISSAEVFFAESRLEALKHIFFKKWVITCFLEIDESEYLGLKNFVRELEI